MKRSTKILTGILVGVNALIGAGFALQSLPVDGTDASGYVPFSWWYTTYPTPPATTTTGNIWSTIDAHGLNNTEVKQQQQGYRAFDTWQNAFVQPTTNVKVNSNINATATTNSTTPVWNPLSYYDPHCTHYCTPSWYPSMQNTGGSSNTTVKSDINAQAVNNTTVWQQQQTSNPHMDPLQMVLVKPTATTNVTSNINANSQPGSTGWVNGGTSSTNVNSAIDATAINNTAVWQQQQTDQPFGVGQTAVVQPTATVNVNSTINANSGWSH